MLHWYTDVVAKKYATFDGRAGRQEFWMFFLANIIVNFVINIVEGIIGTGGVISGLYSLAVLVPQIALGTRRLHDIGKSGWWQLAALVPVLGWLALLFFYVQGSQAGDMLRQSTPRPRRSARYTPPRSSGHGSRGSACEVAPSISTRQLRHPAYGSSPSM